MNPRARRSGLILDLIKAAGVNGIGRAELSDLMAGEYNNIETARKGVGQSIFQLLKAGSIYESDELLFSRDGDKPKAQRPAQPAGGIAARVSVQGVTQLPAIARKRVPRPVSIYQSPAEFDDIQQILICTGGQWFKVPFRGGVNICIGDGIPTWTATQETNYNISAIRLVHLDGHNEEISVNPKHPVTFDFKD